MKKSLCLLLYSFIMAASATLVSYSQQETDPGLFTKGTFRIGLHNPFTFDLGTYKLDGNKESNWNDLNFRTSLDYFFLNGFGAGIMFNYGREYEKYTDDDTDIYSEFIISAGLIYGTSFGKINFYVKPYVGIGSQVYKFNYGGGSPEYKDHIFRTGIQIVSPIPLDKDNRITLNPKVAWRYTKHTSTEYSTTYDIDSKFYFGAELSMFFGCEELLCDRKTSFENSQDRFARGRNLLEASSRFRVSHHSYKFHWEGGGESRDDKDIENSIDLKLSYKRALFDGFLLGANLSFSRSFYDYQDEETYTEKGIGFSFGPVVEYHPFGKRILRNFFIEGGAGVGISKNEYENEFGVEEYKYFDFYYDLNAGFDYGLSGNLSIVPRLGIESTLNLLQDIEEQDVVTNGYFSLGLRLSF